MKTLVTGGCGFIGTHLVRKLLKLGHEVFVIDNLSSGSSDNMLEGAQYIVVDIRSDIDYLFEDIDCVFHLAAEARIQFSIDNPKHTIDVNVSGTANIIEACRLHKVPRFINSSSSAVYGLTEEFPTNESIRTDCLNPYAATKLAAEEIIHCYTKLYDITAFNLRYFNVFGEDSPVKGPYSLVVGLFLDQLSRSQSLTVVGDGSSCRDFIYVGDVVDANIAAMTAEPEIPSTILNIGSGQNISVLAVAQALSNNITFVPSRIGEAKQTLADITLVKRILGWEPKMMLLDWLNLT